MYPYITGGFLYVVEPCDYSWRSDQAAPAFPITKMSPCVSKAKVELKSFMRMLWEQHIAWTRMTILSLVFHLPDVDVVTARLLQNATDMGNSLRPLYGDQVAQTYGNLIREHLVIAADLVKAAIAGYQNLVAATEKKWYSNADEIAEFLSRINPYLPKEEFRKMFYEHLALTKAEAVAMITKDYKTSIQIYDKIEAQALEMADMITDAIAKQFPNIYM
ncbi:acetylglutamate kinase [Paenibacillus kribbensis]|uniref:acetylglutamate kinase n=1 Tax=Paenibacillus kribbensis TaxID=172713 RepID=UPI000A871D7B|nr:acetylglutamate kinase [Paenibacillus kribbensis]